jgi:hypothetical protein
MTEDRRPRAGRSELRTWHLPLNPYSLILSYRIDHIFFCSKTNILKILRDVLTYSSTIISLNMNKNYAINLIKSAKEY